MMAMTSNRLLAKASVGLLVTLAIYVMFIHGEISAPLLGRSLRKESYKKKNAIYIPSSLDAESQRSLTINLGGGNCEYELPTYDVPEDIDFHKTLIVGYPSGDKRMIFLQMEALTGWAAKDEWDFQFLGDSNNPFIKANFPHHEGIWGWGANADQVVLMVRNIRRSMVEYHDILWDIDYAATWEVATDNMMNLYGERAPIDEFYLWRDDRVLDECHWYGWEIDFWMEGGLLRDMFSHGITTQEHWDLTMNPVVNHRRDLEAFYETKVKPGVDDGSITETYYSRCADGDVSDGCEPVAVISAENLRSMSGSSETVKIANILLADSRTGQYVIDEEAWDCVWEELIVRGKGLKTVYDRPGFVENDYDFSKEMLEEMISQLSRLITKYSGPDWNTKETANRIVELLIEHRALIQAEHDNAPDDRMLKDTDFLGPKERKRRRQMKIKEQSINEEGVGQQAEYTKDYSVFFKALEQQLQENKEMKRKEMMTLAASRKRMGEIDSAINLLRKQMAFGTQPKPFADASKE